MAHVYVDPTVEYSQDSATYAGQVTHTKVVYASGAGGYTVSSFATLLRTVTDAGVGSETADYLVTKLRNGSGNGYGTHTVVAAKASLRRGNGSGTGDSTATKQTSQFRTVSSSGSGGSVATRVRITFGDGTGAGTSSEGVVDLYNAIRSALAGGGATTNDLAETLRTAIGFGYSSGHGTRLIQSRAELFRVSVVSSSGGQSAQGARTAVSSGASQAEGRSFGVFWLNGGQPWEAVIKTRPMSMERAGSRTFRRGVNYSVRLR